MLDTPTLFTVVTAITGLLGMFLLAVWLQERGIRALAWWGAAYLMGGSAVTLWSGQGVFSPLPAWLPNALLFVACGMIWNGARLFHGRTVSASGLVLGGAVWSAAMQVPAFAGWVEGRIVLSSIVIASYAFLTALELRRERRKNLAIGPMAVGIPLLHGAVFLAPVALLALPDGSADGLFAFMALETLLYVVGTAFIVVVLAKEQMVTVHKTAAMTDMLTGLYNRRAFLDAADQTIRRQARKRGPVSVLMFDLDHFKSINDRFGHAVGDDALRLFAQTAAGSMRANDVIGRLGGEEFAAIVAGTAADAAGVAERVRAAFERAGVDISGHRIGATVSIGVGCASAPVAIDALLALADSALYRAKGNGRNRIEIGDSSDAAANGRLGPEAAAVPLAATR